MVKRNKILPRLLLGLCSLQMVLPLIVATSVFLIAKQQQKIISENRNNTAFFEQIRISEQEAGANLDAAKEIVYRGRLYDIRSVQKENGEYVVLALADKDETSMQRLNAHPVNTSDKKSSEHIKILPFLFLFHEQPNLWSFAVTAPVISFVTMAAPLCAAPLQILLRPPCYTAC